MHEDTQQLQGVVIPLPTPFDTQLAVDHAALESYVTWLIDNGIRNLMTTVGTSRFNLLDPDEVLAVNETVVKAAKGRATTVVANPQFGGTPHAEAFARHTSSIGATYFLAFYPERHYGDDNIVSYFESIATAAPDLKILVHEMPMRCGFGGPQRQYSVELLERLLQIENVVGMKEESLEATHSNRIVEAFSKDAVIIGAGGGMSRYLRRDFERGAKAYLGGIGGFFPQIELDFFEHLSAGRHLEASQIVESIEKPYFEAVVPIGWHPALKAALAIKGLLPPHERPPMKCLSEDELDTLRRLLKTNGWL